MKKPRSFQLTSAVLNGANCGLWVRKFLILRDARRRLNGSVPFPARPKTLTCFLYVALVTGLQFFLNSLAAQTCSCSDFPGYKCITSGNLTDLIKSGDLLGYAAAETEPQYIVVLVDINFADPNNTAPYHFASGSQIAMLPDSRLSIRKEVVFSGANLFGCSAPWMGIDVLGGGTLRLLEQSSVANACRAVILHPASKAEVVSNYFANNWIGVYAEGNVQLLGEGIAHNTFDGSQVPSSCSGYGYFSQGIRLINVPQIRIGDQGQNGNPNTITGYEIGIECISSNIEVFNTTFNGSDLIAPAIRLRSDQGVYTAAITGLGNTATAPVFCQNYDIGISAENYNLKVSKASFKYVSNNSIKINKGKFPTWLSLTSNRFENYTHDAVLANQALFSRVDISENLFRDNNGDEIGDRGGLHWSNSQLVAHVLNNHAVVKNNDFYDDMKPGTDPDLVYKTYGIWFNNASRFAFSNNNFYQNYSSPILHSFKGFYLYNSPENDLIGNDFYGNFGSITVSATDSDLRYKGIDVYNSLYNRVFCNYAYNLNEGYFFNGMACDHTTFLHNEMLSNNTGLYLAPGSIIGPQFEQENKWRGNLPANGIAEAQFDGNPDQGLYSLSLFSINSSDVHSDLWADPVIPSNGWFKYSGNNGEILPYICHKARNPNPPFTKANQAAVEGMFPVYQDYPASLWEARLDAYSTLAADSGLRPVNSPEAQFYNSNVNGNIGKLSRARENWNVINRFSEVFESDWEANETAVKQKLADISTQNELMEAATTATAQEQIGQTLVALKSDLEGLKAANENLCAAYKSEVLSRANQLSADLNNISTTDIWEQNLKTVLSLSVEHLLSGNSEWSTNQRNVLEAIADQCRNGGGVGVVLARSAIEKYLWNDKAMCPGAGLPRNDKRIVLEASLAPNPSNGHSRLTFGSPVKGILTARNLQGQIMQCTKLLDVNEMDIDTVNWPNGLFILDMSNEEGLVFAMKLTVIH